MYHIEVTGDPGQTLCFCVLEGDRTLAVIPGQHAPELAGYLARELVTAAEKWESYAALKAKASDACPPVTREAGG